MLAGFIIGFVVGFFLGVALIAILSMSDTDE
jgi:hypothetical protein